MHEKTRKLPFDIAHAGDEIGQFCVGRTLADYRRDAMLRAAVVGRKFEIIGEAAGRLRAFDAATLGQITAAGAIIAFRNRLIHGYDQVDDEIVWDTLQHKLPVLLAGVNALLGPLDREPGEPLDNPPPIKSP